MNLKKSSKLTKSNLNIPESVSLKKCSRSDKIQIQNQKHSKMIRSTLKFLSRTLHLNPSSSFLSITTPSLNWTVLQSSAIVKEKKKKSVVESQHKIDGEMVEVMFTADWDKGDNLMKVEEEIKWFTEEMIKIKDEQRNKKGKDTEK